MNARLVSAYSSVMEKTGLWAATGELQSVWCWQLVQFFCKLNILEANQFCFNTFFKLVYS